MFDDIPDFGAAPAAAPPTITFDNTAAELKTLSSTFFFPWPSRMTVSLAAAFRSSATLITNTEAALKAGVASIFTGGILTAPDKPALVAWGLAFQASSSPGILATRSLNHFRDYFLPLTAVLERSNVDVPLSLIRKWGSLLGFSPDLAEVSAREDLQVALRGRLAGPEELKRASDETILRILNSRGSSAETITTVNRLDHLLQLQALGPSVSDLGILIREDVASAYTTAVGGLESLFDTPCPRQPSLARENPSLVHANFVYTQPHLLKTGHLVALVNALGYPCKIFQFRTPGLWSPLDTSPTFSSVPWGVFVLSKAGLTMLRSSNPALLCSFSTEPVPGSLEPSTSSDMSNSCEGLAWSAPPAPALLQSSSLAPSSSSDNLPPPGSLGNPLLVDHLPMSLSHRDFAPSYHIDSVNASQVARDRECQAAGFLALVNGEPGLRNAILGRSGNIRDPTVVATTRSRIHDVAYKTLEIFSLMVVAMFLNFRYATVYAKDVLSAGGFNLLHVANVIDSSAKFYAFTSLEHLRATWEIWAICYDSVLCVSKSDEFFAALIRPLLAQMTFIGSEDAVNFKHFDVPFVSLMADNIMCSLGALVNSNSPYDEGWLRARWFVELKSRCIWPADIRLRASEWDREQARLSRVSTPSTSYPSTSTATNPAKRVKATHGIPSKTPPTSHSTPQITTSPRAPRVATTQGVPQEICRSALYHQLNVSPKGCTLSSCPRNHFELTKLPKPTLIAACEPIGHPEFKNKVLAAIATSPSSSDSSAVATSATTHIIHATTPISVENKRVQTPLIDPPPLSKLFPIWNRGIDLTRGDSEFDLLTRIDSATALVKRLAPGWFPITNTPVELSTSIADLVLQQSRDFLLQEAELSANNFEIPESVLSDELALLTRTGSFEAFIEFKKEVVRANRFNENRCRLYFSDDPEFLTLLEIARHGATIDVAPNFIPNSKPEPFRASHSSLQHTFLTHAYKFWQKSQGALLPTSVALTLGLNFSPVHWTPKPFTPLGRFLLDLSNSSHSTVLNQPEAKALVDSRFGIVTYPTIHNVVDMLFTAAEDVGWENIVMWKDDIVGAFNQFMFSAASAKLLALRISNLVTLIMFTGVFGWLGSPAVWAVFSRALLRLLTKIIKYILLYCDDFMGFGHKDLARRDQLRLHDILRGIFGPDVINTTKSILPSRIGDSIGWTIDIDQRLLFPNEKGCKKLAAVFFSCNTSETFSTKSLQRMGSLASRYSRAIIGSRPFVRPFYEAASHNRPVYLTTKVKLAIYVWRAISLTLLHSARSLATPLSFVRSIPPMPSYFSISDAGPRGLGVAVRNGNGLLLGFVSYRIPFLALESDFQNLREFMGLILSMLIVHYFAKGTAVFTWTNDNTSALSWAHNDMAKSKSAQAAFLIFTWCKIRTQLVLATTHHIAGNTMGDIDSLSRFIPTTDLPPELDLSHLIPIPSFDALFSLCDPALEQQSNLGPWELSLCNIVTLINNC